MQRRVEPKKAAASANRRGIQSVEIGLRVIDALRKSTGPLTLKELAADSRLPASNCHRYLVSFVRVGYVTQDPLSGRYDLGPELLQAGLAALGRLDPIAVGNDCLARVAELRRGSEEPSARLVRTAIAPGIQRTMTTPERPPPSSAQMASCPV
jgi:hypothetical protein